MGSVYIVVFKVCMARARTFAHTGISLAGLYKLADDRHFGLEQRVGSHPNVVGV